MTHDSDAADRNAGVAVDPDVDQADVDQADVAEGAAVGDSLRREEAVFRDLVGRHGDHYLAIRRRMQRTDNGLIWNWWAFFLNVVWFLSKRMWGAAIVISAAFVVFFAVYARYIVTGILVPSWATPQAAYAAIALMKVALVVGVPLFCGLFGNKLYVTYINARVRRALAAAGEPEAATDPGGAFR